MKIIDLIEYGNLFTKKCSTLFNCYSWLSILRKTYGLEIKVVINNENDFFLPFSILEDNCIKSIPFGDYILINYPKVELNRALELLKETYPEHYFNISIVSKEYPIIKDFVQTKKGLLNQINIKKWKESRDWETAYERNIRNALNYGLAVKISNSFESVVNFYKLHEQLRITKFKKLPQPFVFFNNIFEEFIVNRKGFILEAWSKESLIASWVILINNDVLYYKFGASDAKYLHLKPNDLLFRSLMQYGSDNKFRTIDLGFSGTAKAYEGLIRFKSKEGGDKTPIYQIEQLPDEFNINIQNDKAKDLNELVSKAIDSNNLDIIREASKLYYHMFA
jgi:hypothetical protein